MEPVKTDVKLVAPGDVELVVILLVAEIAMEAVVQDVKVDVLIAVAEIATGALVDALQVVEDVERVVLADVVVYAREAALLIVLLFVSQDVKVDVQRLVSAPVLGHVALLARVGVRMLVRDVPILVEDVLDVGQTVRVNVKQPVAEIVQLDVVVLVPVIAVVVVKDIVLEVVQVHAVIIVDLLAVSPVVQIVLLDVLLLVKAVAETDV